MNVQCYFRLSLALLLTDVRVGQQHTDANEVREAKRCKQSQPGSDAVRVGFYSVGRTMPARFVRVLLAIMSLVFALSPAGARFNFRKSVELQEDSAVEGEYQAFIFIKQLKVGGSTMAGIVRQFMQLKWGTSCIEPMRREFTLSGKDG